MGWRMKGMTPLLSEQTHQKKGNIEINVLNKNIKKYLLYELSTQTDSSNHN